jgi:hypothetical protein
MKKIYILLFAVISISGSTATARASDYMRVELTRLPSGEIDSNYFLTFECKDPQANFIEIKKEADGMGGNAEAGAINCPYGDYYLPSEGVYEIQEYKTQTGSGLEDPVGEKRFIFAEVRAREVVSLNTIFGYYNNSVHDFFLLLPLILMIIYTLYIKLIDRYGE